MSVQDEIGVSRVMQDNEEYITIRKAAERWKYTPARFHQWIRLGRLKAYRLRATDRPLFLKVSEVEAFLTIVPAAAEEDQ